MRRPPLRSLILIPILATVTIGFAAFSVYVDRSVHQDLIAGVDDELGRVAQASLPPGDGAPDRAPAPITSGQIGDAVAIDDTATPVELLLNADGTLVGQRGSANPFSDSDLAGIATLTDGDHTFDDPSYRIRTTRRADSTIIVTALDLATVNDTIANLRRTLFGGAIVILALQAVAVGLIASYLTRPLTRMTSSARRIAGGHLDTTIGEPSGSSEIADLATDLDRMLHQLQANLDSSERSAAEATQARNNMERFLADASHELRTPLTALKGYSDLYRGHMLQQPAELDRAMGRIGSESERMTRLVNNMLQLTRNGAPNETTPSVVDLGAVVADVAGDLRAASPDTEIELRGPVDGQLAVIGNRDQLHQAILNVVSNACRHTEPGTPVHVELDQHDTNALITVIDHGPGVAPEHADQIFLPFYRVDASRSRDGEAGAGLGLALTKQIVDAHGGTITVQPTPGGGATFIVTLRSDSPGAHSPVSD